MLSCPSSWCTLFVTDLFACWHTYNVAACPSRDEPALSSVCYSACGYDLLQHAARLPERQSVHPRRSDAAQRPVVTSLPVSDNTKVETQSGVTKVIPSTYLMRSCHTSELVNLTNLDNDGIGRTFEGPQRGGDIYQC